MCLWYICRTVFLLFLLLCSGLSCFPYFSPSSSSDFTSVSLVNIVLLLFLFPFYSSSNPLPSSLRLPSLPLLFLSYFSLLPLLSYSVSLL